MFVLANMAASSVSGPIKIRNMSAGGALIEGETLPNIGEPLRLVRSGLSVSGKVVWRQPRKAGLCFDSEIDVSDWLPTGSGTRQQDVDRIVHEVKEARIDTNAQPRTNLEPTPITSSDLLNAAAAIEALADALAEDDGVVAKYATRLQVLDIASQLLRKVAVPRQAVTPGV
ncbi:MAG: PilZ domain-containing protein [Porphyrobacter sp.]|nr:PilZ domain-containing protein [Porphyrobacter sp.]